MELSVVEAVVMAPVINYDAITTGRSSGITTIMSFDAITLVEAVVSTT